jgi:hypothetical protein
VRVCTEQLCTGSYIELYDDMSIRDQVALQMLPKPLAKVTWCPAFKLRHPEDRLIVAQESWRVICEPLTKHDVTLKACSVCVAPSNARHVVNDLHRLSQPCWDRTADKHHDAGLAC